MYFTTSTFSTRFNDFHQYRKWYNIFAKWSAFIYTEIFVYLLCYRCCACLWICLHMNKRINRQFCQLAKIKILWKHQLINKRYAHLNIHTQIAKSNNKFMLCAVVWFVHFVWFSAHTAHFKPIDNKNQSPLIAFALSLRFDFPINYRRLRCQ